MKLQYFQDANLVFSVYKQLLSQYLTSNFFNNQKVDSLSFRFLKENSLFKKIFQVEI